MAGFPANKLGAGGGASAPAVITPYSPTEALNGIVTTSCKPGSMPSPLSVTAIAITSPARHERTTIAGARPGWAWT